MTRSSTAPGTTNPNLNNDVATLSLAEVMRALGLDAAATLLDAAAQKAIARNEAPTSLLDSLMREQLRAHVEGRARNALRRAAIFPLTTLDTYDFDYPKSIDRDLVFRAASLDFIREKTNCVFVGPSGVGKTHLANAIGQLACLRGYRVRFTTAADLVTSIQIKTGRIVAQSQRGGYVPRSAGCPLVEFSRAFFWCEVQACKGLDAQPKFILS